MFSINFFVEQIDFNLKLKKLIRQWILHTIQKEKGEPGELNYIFCSDKYLLKINKTYLNHTTLTDIVTFPTDPFYNHQSPAPLGLKKGKKSINGDIFISIERVKENAKKFNTPFEMELKRVMVHGVLHLCGHGDKSSLEAKKMRRLEDYYLNMYLTSHTKTKKESPSGSRQ